MATTIARAVRGVSCGLVLAAGLVVAPGASPASANTVTPSTGLRDGQTVQVTISPTGSTHNVVALCDADYLTYSSRGAVDQFCSVDPGSRVSAERPADATFVLDLVIRRDITTVTGGTRHCGDAREDCAIVHWSSNDEDPTDPADGYLWMRSSPVDVVAHDMLTLTPRVGLSSSATTSATGTAFAPGPLTLAQCATTWAVDPTASSADESCGPVTAVTVADDGTFSTSIDVADPLVTRSGASVPCGTTGCVVVASSAADPVLVRRDLGFGEPSVEIDTDGNLVAGEPIAVSVTGIDAEALDIDLCTDVAVLGTYTGCRTWGGHRLELTNGSYSGQYVPDDESTTIPPGIPADCRVVACSIKVYVAGPSNDHPLDEETVIPPLPISFGPPTTIALTPSDGLLEAQAVTAHVENVTPGRPYDVSRCYTPTGRCTLVTTTIADADGTFDAAVPVSHRYGANLLCRDRCSVQVWYSRNSSVSRATAPYRMAAGSVTSTPSTALVDGQDVVVAGNDLMPTYAGRQVWFPTGGWALVQCAAAVGAAPSLAEVFTHCGIPPGGGGVDVPASTSSTTVQAQATVARILGGTTDCASSPGACVVGLVRWEQDATVSAHLTPLSFAGST